jgi:hypothetical protein
MMNGGPVDSAWLLQMLYSTLGAILPEPGKTD